MQFFFVGEMKIFSPVNIVQENPLPLYHELIEPFGANSGFLN